MTETKVTDSVWIETYIDYPYNVTLIIHNCDKLPDNEFGKRRFNSGVMELRDNDEGPNYWCSTCGYVLDEGASMAIRLFEIDL